MTTEQQERLRKLESRLEKAEAAIAKWEALVARAVDNPSVTKVLAMLGVRLS
jgi:hypothetical protein